VKQKESAKYPTTSLSFPDEALLQAARARAKALGMSLSRYINHLVERDIQRGGAFVLEERRTPESEPQIAAAVETDAQRRIRQSKNRK